MDATASYVDDGDAHNQSRRKLIEPLIASAFEQARSSCCGGAAGLRHTTIIDTLRPQVCATGVSCCNPPRGRRTCAHTSPVETDQERLAERFAHVAAIADDVRAADRALLSRLPREQLLQQYDARQLLHQHMRYLWEAAKTGGLDPATDPAWMSLAMLCDLTADLLHAAATAHSRLARAMPPRTPAWVMPPAGHAPPPVTD